MIEEVSRTLAVTRGILIISIAGEMAMINRLLRKICPGLQVMKRKPSSLRSATCILTLSHIFTIIGSEKYSH